MTPKMAFCECTSASIYFADFLEVRGIEAIICVCDVPIDKKRAYHLWHRLSSIEHMVVFVEGFGYVDWTARQLDVEADVPQVMMALPESWTPHYHIPNRTFTLSAANEHRIARAMAGKQEAITFAGGAL